VAVVARSAAAVTVDIERARRTWILIAVGAGVVALTALLLAISQTGVAGTHFAHPDPAGTHVYGGVPRAHPPYWGITNWPLVFQVLSVGLNALCWAPFVWIWWRDGRFHPGLVLMFALWFSCTALDPLANWGYAAVYDPRVLHFPVDWPYVSLAPLVEPIVAVAGWQWWYILPGLIGFAIWRRLSRRAAPGSWIERHPLLSLFLLGVAVGSVIDVAAEVLFIKSMIYIYSQVKGPMLWGGHSWQFPIIWGPLLQVLLYGFTAMFLWRDDKGRTVCGRFTERVSLLRKRPVLGEVTVATVALTFSYLVGIGVMATLKQNATAVARPWPFQETKTYDPTGAWQSKREPGPFVKGVWSDGPLP
jgi:hypothetical protein